MAIYQGDFKVVSGRRRGVILRNNKPLPLSRTLHRWGRMEFWGFYRNWSAHFHACVNTAAEILAEEIVHVPQRTEPAYLKDFAMTMLVDSQLYLRITSEDIEAFHHNWLASQDIWRGFCRSSPDLRLGVK